MKGFIMAAGLGRRLEPFTRERPKPLFPAGRMTFLDRAALFLKRCGITRAAVNVHHLGGAIRSHAARRDMWGLDVVFSEEPRLLGTGGGARRAAELLGADSLIVVAGDIAADVDPGGLLAAHERSGAPATIVAAAAGDTRRYGGIRVRPGGRVTDMAGILRREGGRLIVNGSIYILEKELADRLPGPGGCLVRDFFIPLLMEGLFVNAFVHEGFWAEGGTPALLLDLNRRLLDLESRSGEGQNGFLPEGEGRRGTAPFFVGENVARGRDALIGPHAVVGDGCRLGAGSRVRDSVLLPGAVVEEGEEVAGAVRSRAFEWRRPEDSGRPGPGRSRSPG